MIPNILASLEAYVMTNGYTDKAAMIDAGMITAANTLEVCTHVWEPCGGVVLDTVPPIEPYLCVICGIRGSNDLMGNVLAYNPPVYEDRAGNRTNGPHKVNERYLDDEDMDKCYSVGKLIGDEPALRTAQVSELLQALETLRTHLRRKYYGG